MAGSPHDPTAQSYQPAQSQPAPASQPLPQYEAEETRTVTAAGVGAAPAPTPQPASSLPQPASTPPQPASSLPQPGLSGRYGGSAENAGYAEQVVRYGPGVPAAGHASQAAPTAEQVWRAGLPNASRPPRRLRRLAGPALSVALLVASGAVIYLRLHHGPFGVTGVAITAQVRHGCTEDITGRVGTSGAAGTVSYQWVFDPRLTAPRPLSQSVASGQSATYVTAAVEGHGHGKLAQTVTLLVLGPGGGSATAHVALSC